LLLKTKILAKANIEMKFIFFCIIFIFLCVNQVSCWHKKPDNLVILSKDLVNKQKSTIKYNVVETKKNVYGLVDLAKNMKKSTHKSWDFQKPATRSTEKHHHKNLIELSKDLVNKQKSTIKYNVVETKKTVNGLIDLAENLKKSTPKLHDFQKPATRSTEKHHHKNLNHHLRTDVFDTRHHLKNPNLNLLNLVNKIRTHHKPSHHSASFYDFRSGQYARYRGETCSNHFDYDGYKFGHFECPIEGFNFMDTACCGLKGEQYCCTPNEAKNERIYRYNTNFINQNNNSSNPVGKVNFWFILIPLLGFISLLIIIGVIIYLK
jgi:hypothetical protein